MRTNRAVAKLDVATEQAKADGHRHERHGEGGQQFENERREERHLQGGHGGGAVAVRDVADRCHLGLGPAEDLEGREAGHHVEEVAGQALEQTGLSSHPNLRRGAHQGHEQRDQRHRHRDDHRRYPVGPQHHDDDGDRDDDGQEQLREIAGEVAVQGVDAAGRQHDEAARSAPGRCRRARVGRSAPPGRSAGPTWRTPRPVGQHVLRARRPASDRGSPRPGAPPACGRAPGPGGGRRHRRSCWRSATPGPAPARRSRHREQRSTPGSGESPARSAGGGGRPDRSGSAGRALLPLICPRTQAPALR